MTNLTELQNLVDRFHANIDFYKDARNAYNEHSCRIEYIDPLLKLLGWDVANEKGVAPQYREVIAENYSTRTDRPDYTITLRGVPKFFVEAKKPAVDITRDADPAIQTRKYGWNAKHRLAVLTNFEYLAIYDTCHIAHEDDACAVARYRLYHYTEYVEKIEEIVGLIARDTVYSGDFDAYLDANFPSTEGQTQQVDTLFLSQINEWRVALSNELYAQGGRYASLEVLNDVVQEFINQIVFLRICEDKNLPLYHKLKDTITDTDQLQSKLEELFRSADRRYNSGMFSGEDIIFDLSWKVIKGMIEDLYYPQSPYLFNIIEPNLLGKIYEIFLTEQLVLLENNTIGLGKKKDCQNRSVVTTPTEIVKYMVDKTLSKVCEGKKPAEILNISVADIACGSGIFLEEAFAYLQDYCVQWYINNGQTDHLIETGIDLYKLPLQEKKDILCSCIYGIDIDIHAVEVAKFSLLIKLIEDETAPSVAEVVPILPDLGDNIQFGNSLVSQTELNGICQTYNRLGKNACTSHKIEARDLYNLVLKDIQELAAMALKDADAFYQRLSSRMECRYMADASEMQKERERLEARNREIDDMFLNLYTDKAKGVLSEQRFMKLTAAMEQEQEENQRRLQELMRMLQQSDAQESEVRTFIREIRQYATIQELDETVLNRLISRILVGEVKKVDGQKVQEVRIVYNFVGEIPATIE